MKQTFTHKIVLAVLLIFAGMTGFAQNFLPTLSDNYMGANQVMLQPAAIVDSRTMVDVNIIGVSNEVINNMVRFESKGIFKVKALFTDPDWWNDYTYAVDENGKNKSLFVDQTLLGPSFMAAIGNKHAVGFTYKVRSIMNAENISEPLARSMYYEFEDSDQWNQWHYNEDIRAVHHMYADYGLSYATEVLNRKAHYLKAGLTVKLVQGLGAAYMQADDLYYYLYKPEEDPGLDADYASWNSPAVNFGVSGNWGTIDNSGDFSFDGWEYVFVAKPSFGFDLGVVYEFRPKYKDFRYTMNGNYDLERRDCNKYLLRVGVSVLDLGRLRYEKEYQSADFSAQFTQNYTTEPDPLGITNWMYLDDVELGTPPYALLADTLQNRYEGGSTSPLSGNENEFKIKLPTAISLQFDVRLLEGFYVNLTTFTSLYKESKPVPAARYASNYSVTPRYERKWFGVSLPVTYNPYGKVDVGLGLRAAFLYLGVNNVFSGLFADPYGTNFYIGFKIPIFSPEPPADMDRDGISDDKDKCISIPGIWDFWGCPDTDGDGIPDMDDKCPKDPGPSLTRGCPDRDNDGVIDNVDQCPDEAGLAQFNGCPDSDGDGIRNEVDQCPDVPGTEAAMGCPDRDNDGVADKDDACPDQFGKKEFGGCPFQDSDGDGIMDDQDLCPQQAGPAENTGCPWADTDADGVWDKDDRCPLTPGDPLNFGCPVIKTEEAAVLKTAFENLEFETGKAVIRSSSFASLDNLAKLMLEKPAWKLHISGHTDNVGNDDSNMKLSKDRAESTAKYLKGKGVASDRFIVDWFGETKPIADNGTPEGRQKNRRVEMEIVFD